MKQFYHTANVKTRTNFRCIPFQGLLEEHFVFVGTPCQLNHVGRMADFGVLSSSRCTSVNEIPGNCIFLSRLGFPFSHAVMGPLILLSMDILPSTVVSFLHVNTAYYVINIETLTDYSLRKFYPRDCGHVLEACSM